MNATAQLQLIGASSSSTLLLLIGVTHLGAALAHHEANLRRAADTAATNRRREAERSRQQRIRAATWAAICAPPRPVIAPTCHVRAETVPLTTVQPRRARHRKGPRQ